MHGGAVYFGWPDQHDRSVSAVGIVVAGAPLTLGYPGNSARMAAFDGIFVEKLTRCATSSWLAALVHQAIDVVRGCRPQKQVCVPLHPTQRGPGRQTPGKPVYRMMNITVRAMKGLKACHLNFILTQVKSPVPYRPLRVQARRMA